jgi:arylsulfatase A-like enzyme
VPIPAARILVAALLVAAGVGCGRNGAPPPAPASRPALILVTLDTFRADHLGCAGHPAVRTPHLDALARGAAMWTDAVSAIPLTTPSHATILSGLTPRAHGVLKNRMVLADRVRTVAEILKEAGWRTGAVVSSPVVLGPELGLSAGFDSYEVVEPAERPARGEGRHTTEAARRWLSANGGPGSFLWAHYFDAHLPYLPPDPLPALYDPDYDGPFALPAGPVQGIFSTSDEITPADVAHLAALYAGEITFLDRCVGDLLRAPEAGGAVVLVTADHGEGLWEHNRYFGHDVLLYETSVRVPMILRRPASAAVTARAQAASAAGGPAGLPGGLSTEPARTTDVAPTLLGLCGVPSGPMEGRDLLRDPAPAGDDLAFILETHPAEEKAEPIFALRTGTEKVIWIQRERRHESYDLAADPAERHDLGETADELYRFLAGDLEIDLRERPPGRPKTVDDERGMDDATREALESLGYVND